MGPMPLILALGDRGRWIHVTVRPAWSTEWVPGKPGLHHETVWPGAIHEELIF